MSSEGRCPLCKDSGVIESVKTSSGEVKNVTCSCPFGCIHRLNKEVALLNLKLKEKNETVQKMMRHRLSQPGEYGWSVPYQNAINEDKEFEALKIQNEKLIASVARGKQVQCGKCGRVSIMSPEGEMAFFCFECLENSNVRLFEKSESLEEVKG